MAEVDPLILSYSHLAHFPREKEALHMLKKIASFVKPIMRARKWRVGELVEFFPEDMTLLGMNTNRGEQICLRLRHPRDSNRFLQLEEVIDTMLHELAHNVHGPHDEKFHALWNQLRDEHDRLLIKGFSGEGFLTKGQQVGGKRIPKDEARRLARARAAAAAKSPTFTTGSGQRLGGAGPQRGQDIRKTIVDAIDRRTPLKGCANENQTPAEIRKIADTATKNGFRTQAEEDAANEVAIAQALFELVEEEERAQKGSSYIPPSVQTSDPRDPFATTAGPSRGAGGSAYTWECEICTLVNPASYLSCDACGTERSGRASQLLAERSAQRERAFIDLT
ncbi:WLM-domain-containing protein [Hypomontagnella monticulosa]|nr:WLM-domain-containing protein [Hypomontagnella monticulosa]